MKGLRGDTIWIGDDCRRFDVGLRRAVATCAEQRLIEPAGVRGSAGCSCAFKVFGLDSVGCHWGRLEKRGLNSIRQTKRTTKHSSSHVEQ